MRYKIGDRLFNKHSKTIFEVVRNDIPYHKGLNRYKCKAEGKFIQQLIGPYVLLQQDLDRMVLITPENEESIKLLYADKEN